MSFDDFFDMQRSEFEKECVKRALANSDTRRLFGMLLEESGFLSPSMRSGGDPYVTAFREGQRIMGQRVFELLLSASDAKPVSCMKEFARSLAELRKNALLVYNQDVKDEFV